MTSKTKKRLSSEPWCLTICCLSLVCCLVLYSFAIYAVTLEPERAIVYGHIPVLPVAPGETMPSKEAIRHETPLVSTSPMIVLTSNAFYFGDLQAFTKDFANVRNKFYINHIEGSPQLGQLLETMNQWLTTRSSQKKNQVDHLPVVLLPTAEVPLSIVIQIMDGLRKSDKFSHVVLATGVL